MMSIFRLKFTHKFIMLIFLLIILVSSSLMFTVRFLFNDGKRKIQQGVTEELDALRTESLEEFETFTDVVDAGIRQASGLVAIEKIIAISAENQERFLEVVNEAVGQAGDKVARAVELEKTIFKEGLDELLSDTTDSMSDMMEFDNSSMNVLASVATFNINSLSTSSMDSLKRFMLSAKRFEKKLLQSQELQNEDLDNLLIRIITTLEESGQENEDLVSFLVEAFDEMKNTSIKRQQILYQELNDEFEMQSKVVAEELSLVNKKISHAVSLELDHAVTIQEEEIDAAIDNLLKNQLRIQKEIDTESETFMQVVGELQTNLPLQLKEEGEDVLKKIEEQSSEAGKNAENAKTRVSGRLKESMNATAATFETGITQTEHVITKTLEDSSARTLVWSSLIAVTCAVLSLGVGIFIIRAITRPLNQTVQLVGKVSDGDFSTTLAINTRTTHKEDEVGKLLIAMNEMVRSFRHVLGQVQRSGIKVASSATELSATARQQEATMKLQVESIDKVVTSTQEISNVATHLVETMQQVATMSQDTAGIASSGRIDLARMKEAMQHMENASLAISGRLGAINEKTENITNVVTTITKVAEQTNLLSLNAAIEAEKAGEYGRGFTVVAREIRRLADQTAVATLNIERMVHEMQSAVSAGVMEMDKFIAEVRRSAEDVEKISTQLTRIIEQVQALTPNFEEVNVAVVHQSANAQEINKAMMHLNEEMQQTRDSLHETYSTIEQLNKTASGLQEEVSRFRVN
jgi:methyl-accepting chemotaxis protein